MKKIHILFFVMLITITISAWIYGCWAISEYWRLKDNEKFITATVIKEEIERIYVFNADKFDKGVCKVYCSKDFDNHISVGDEVVLMNKNGKWVLVGYL